jgi:hypothetical protein
MTKLLLSSSLVVAALCAPALADPAKPYAPPSGSPPAASPVQQPLQLKLTVRVGSDARVHELAVFDSGCNQVEDKTAAYEDEIRICAHPAVQGVFVDVNWKTRNGPNEYRTTSGAIVARRGGQFEVGRAGGTRFTLQTM